MLAQLDRLLHVIQQATTNNTRVHRGLAVTQLNCVE